MRQNSFFNYSRKERTGIGVLVTLMLLTAIFPRIFPRDPVLESSAAVVAGQPNPPVNEVQPNNGAAWRATPKPTSLPARAGVDYPVSKSAWRAPDNRRHRDWPAAKSNHFLVRSARRQIDINKADTSAFISLPFIGSKLAARIVLFRTKLGGFYSREQLSEVYGIQDSVYHIVKNFLTCDAADIEKLN
ncbi:MAG TPA: helix-hairpin-helix domain-containing protein, partial [Flavitalea sp.]|nr:helix-hairpin-helix domain-containing protein [Flavitalea sp.]